MKLKRPLKFAIAAAVILACFAGYCVAQREWLTKSYYTLSSPKVSAAFDGFKICHLSDLHNHEFGRDNARLLNVIAKENPDMIAITGDLIDSRHTDIEVSLEFVSKCVEIAPTYYVCGNHEDRFTPEEQAYIYSSLEEMGAVLLEGESVGIFRESESIYIGGFFNKYENEDGDYDIFDRKDKLNVLLYHRPTNFDLFKATGADLVLSGHAHGGQFRIPFVGGLLAPDEGFFPKYSEGMHDIDGTKLIVSRGLGNSLMPIRLNNPPEVIFVTLKNSTI